MSDLCKRKGNDGYIINDWKTLQYVAAVFFIGKDVLNNMESDVKIMPMPDYPDVIPIHKDLTEEELNELIEKNIEEDKKYTEWPDI